LKKIYEIISKFEQSKSEYTQLLNSILSNEIDDEGNTVFHIMAKYNKFALTKSILKEEIDFDKNYMFKHNDDGDSPLDIFCRHVYKGTSEIANLYLDLKPDYSQKELNKMLDLVLKNYSKDLKKHNKTFLESDDMLWQLFSRGASRSLFVEYSRSLLLGTFIYASDNADDFINSPKDYYPLTGKYAKFMPYIDARVENISLFGKKSSAQFTSPFLLATEDKEFKFVEPKSERKEATHSAEITASQLPLAAESKDSQHSITVTVPPLPLGEIIDKLKLIKSQEEATVGHTWTDTVGSKKLVCSASSASR
jgi:hypothetical protein